VSELQAQRLYHCGPRAVQSYVQALSTSEVAGVAEQVRRKLRTRLSTAQRERWEMTWDALLLELEARQLTLWEPPGER
jgi:hypothetical protein